MDDYSYSVMDSSYLIQMHSVASSALFHWTLAVEHCLMPAVLVNQFAAFPFAKCSYMHCIYTRNVPHQLTYI